MCKLIFIRCGFCAAEVEKPLKEITRKHREGKYIHFCGIACFRAYQQLNYSMTWQACHYRARYNALKGICRITYCDKCNKSYNVRQLEVHHIDGNYKNNEPENLTKLCTNCHPQQDRIMRQVRSLPRSLV